MSESRGAGGGALRRLLDGLYASCAALAAIALVAVFLLILLQVAGAPFGYAPRAADEFAGYAMAASAFLAFAYAFRKGDHIRVVLLVERLHGKARGIADLGVMLVSTGLVGYFAWYSVRLAWQSWDLHELSQGLVPVPIWLPQSAMAIGNVVLLIAFLDTLIEVGRGRPIIDADVATLPAADR